MKIFKLFQTYRDGFRILKWGYRLHTSLILGFQIGISIQKEKGFYDTNKYDFSFASLIISLGFFQVKITHIMTYRNISLVK